MRGGSASAPSLIEVQAAVDETRHGLEDAARRGEQAQQALASAQERRRVGAEQVERALERLHESDARMAAVGERLGQLGSAARAAAAESERTEQAVVAAERALVSDREELTALQQRLDDASAEPGEEEPSTDERDRLEQAATAARASETELRLTLRTREERARAMAGRADSLESAARPEIAARERAAARRERRRREAAVAEAVRRGADYAAVQVATSLELASTARAAAEADRTEREAALASVRREIGTLGDELRELTDSVHRDEVARTQQRLRIETLQTKAVEEHGIDPDLLVEDFGPHQLVPVVPDRRDECRGGRAAAAAAVRAGGAGEAARAAERELARSARSTRWRWRSSPRWRSGTSSSPSSWRTSRQPQARPARHHREVDERVEQVFTEAYHDTAAQFERVFERLFPGGEGRLVLTDPDNMLTTGIEVEARPPGKKIKRLSLLSGGERSLTAVALLVAIFKARPSPFYIMDEVEAALDDTNLGRLITLFEELRDSSQLIVITHQKRTMEIADALYGVTMRGDGVTTVVSQRIRDVQSA